MSDNIGLNKNLFALDREIFESPLWYKSYHEERGKKVCSKFMAFVYIVGNANYQYGEVDIFGTNTTIPVKRGQFFTSQEGLSQVFGWSRGKVSKFLKDHKNDLKIDTYTSKDRHNGYTLITIKNYDDFQFTPKNLTKNDTHLELKIGTTNKVNKLNTPYKVKKINTFSPLYLEDLPPEERKKVEFI